MATTTRKKPAAKKPEEPLDQVSEVEEPLDQAQAEGVWSDPKMARKMTRLVVARQRDEVAQSKATETRKHLRVLAVTLLNQGVPLQLVADTCRVSRQTMTKWWDQEGEIS